MLTAWRAAFEPVPERPRRRGRARATAEPSTLLAEAGLSARALSALEPFGAATVGDLLALDPVQLNRLAGVADVTRREIKARARDWRDRPAATVTGRGRGLKSHRRNREPARSEPILVNNCSGTRRHGPRGIASRHGPLAARTWIRAAPFASQIELERCRWT